MLSTGSLAEGLVGAASGSVAILGLFGVYPEVLLSLAVAGAGGVLLLQGGAIAGRFPSLASKAGENPIESPELGGGLIMEFLCGSAAVLLGLLSLLGIASDILLPVAVIVLGVTLLVSSGISARVSVLLLHRAQEGRHVRAALKESADAAAGAQMLIGAGALALGIVALKGLSPITLSLAAMLGIGVSDLLSGTAIASRLTRPFGT
jgi:hypothetical protein